MADGDSTITLAELDARLREVEAMQELILRLLSTRKPLDDVLDHYGATDTQGHAFYRLLDEMATRAKGREQDRPTFGYFNNQVAGIFPALRGDRDFIALVIDTMRIERSIYRDLYAYMAAQGWPQWDS
jgi:hypothetical protein